MRLTSIPSEVMEMVRTMVTAGVLAALLLGPGPASAQAPDYPQHFRVYTGTGEPASLADIIKALSGMDVVLIGEAHTDPIGHYVEAELVRGALAAVRPEGNTASARPMALSLEMFERDVQQVVDEYLQGLITEAQFRADARPWEYYQTDYHPMVELAKSAGIPVIAANAPRRYVNRVSRLGRDALNQLPEAARAYLPPLPWPQPSEAYRQAWTSLMASMPMTPQCTPPGGPAAPAAPDSQAAPPRQMPPAATRPSHMASFMENGLQAQSLWDASLANAVTTFLAKHPG
ncbi:MAG: hypothetical protein FIB01_07460, partial [Gemmatimonadetes bacterium]|nr:hypothetical protein [Gemmatimonadota bacterium]